LSFSVDYDKMKTPKQQRMEDLKNNLMLNEQFKSVDNDALATHSAHMKNVLQEQELAESRSRKERDKKNIKKIQEFSNVVKMNLIAESLKLSFDKVAESLSFTEKNKSVGHKMIESLVEEEGSENLLERFATKNVYLSSFANSIEQFHTAVLESKKCDCGAEEGEDDICFSFDKDLASGFIDAIEDATPARATKTISDRVEKAVSDFVDDNTENKMQIKTIYDKAKAKIANTTDTAIKEELAGVTRSAIASINMKPTNLYGVMVREMATSIMKNPEMKKVYESEGGRLDMGKIFGDTEVLYTVIETANTLGVIDVDGAYIKKMISDIRHN